MNLLTVHQCSKKKFKTSLIFIIDLAVTAAVVGIAMPFLMRGQNYGNGNGLFVLIGFVYLVPLYFMYEQKMDRTIIVMCSAFVYSMLAFTLAVQIGKLFGEAYFAYITMVSQTLIYLVSAPPFLKFITGKFVFVLDNIPHQINHYLRWLSLVWFVSLVTVNFAYVTGNGLAKALSLTLMGASAALSYYLIYQIVKGSKNIEVLQKIVHTDQLTGLANRNQLFDDADMLIQANCAFTMLYIDLDEFKTINDEQGHLAGDQYLQAFAMHFSRLLGKAGTLYRMSGDEFIALCPQKSKQQIKELALSQSLSYEVGGLPFQGFSFGVAAFPEDSASLDYLIYLADLQMYEQKEENHKKLKETQSGVLKP